MREYSGAEKEIMEQLGSIWYNSDESKTALNIKLM